MVGVPFPTITAPGKFSESGGALVNAYVEPLPDGRVARKRVPGLRQLSSNATHVGCRGLLAINNTLLIARGSRLTQIVRSSGNYTEVDIGTMPGEGPVFFARNNKSAVPDIVAVTNSTAYEISLSAAPTSYSDGDVGSPNSVTQISGYFIFSYGDGRMSASGLNSTSISTLDYATAETRIDGLIRVIQVGRDIIAFGSASYEIWSNTGEPVGFPLSYRDTVDVGLASATAIAGFEGEGAGQTIFVASDNTVRALSGYQASRVSTHVIERLIEAVPDKSTLRAQFYMHAGHAVWALTCPAWTLCYDISNGVWYARKSYGRENWRAAYSAKVFGGWCFGDEATGQIYMSDESYYREASDPLVFEVKSGTMSGFPRRARWLGMDIDMMAGVGLAGGEAPTQSDPTCVVRLSRDGGVTFSNGLTRSIGKQGEYSRNIRFTGADLGSVSQRGAQVHITVSDPVPVTLFGAEASFSERLS